MQYSVGSLEWGVFVYAYMLFTEAAIIFVGVLLFAARVSCRFPEAYEVPEFLPAVCFSPNVFFFFYFFFSESHLGDLFGR